MTLNKTITFKNYPSKLNSRKQNEIRAQIRQTSTKEKSNQQSKSKEKGMNIGLNQDE